MTKKEISPSEQIASKEIRKNNPTSQTTVMNQKEKELSETPELWQLIYTDIASLAIHEIHEKTLPEAIYSATVSIYEKVNPLLQSKEERIKELTDILTELSSTKI